MTTTLYYFHDPMCSWCWGYEPEWSLLQTKLHESINVQYVLGGLAPDSNEIMPAAMQQTIASYWKRIETELGATFNYDFWTQCQPKRSTYPACRAAIAARWQEQELAMITAIQKAYYLRAMNPSEVDTLVQLAEECHLDVEQFADDLASQQTEDTLQVEIDFSRNAPIRGFPSLLLESQGQFWVITVDYKNHLVSLGEINQALSKTG